MKKLLAELFPNCKLMTINECIEKLNWKTENPPESNNTGEITCSCGDTVKVGGWIGTEQAYCPNCGKGMQDVTGVMPAGKNCAGMIDYDNVILPDDGRVWIPENVWGLK